MKGVIFMAALCNCQDLKTKQLKSSISNDSELANIEQEDPPTQCQGTVHETVCVQADVTINPAVTHGDIKSFCIGTPVIGPCTSGSLQDSCVFTVHQHICVQVPLTFTATADIGNKKIICGTPSPGTCPQGSAPCTHTIGYFKNLDDTELNAIIAMAGGQIILGKLNPDGSVQGISIVVHNATEAKIVLSFGITNDPDLKQLYAQLLAAKLNLVLGADCPFADAAITAGDNYLANPTPNINPSDLAAALEQFNSGNGGDDCPGHCND